MLIMCANAADAMAQVVARISNFFMLPRFSDYFFLRSFKQSFWILWACFLKSFIFFQRAVLGTRMVYAGPVLSLLDNVAVESMTPQ